MPSDQPNGRRNRRRARQACQAGVHRYGEAKAIGGGITRRACPACGSVTIDLTAASPPANPTLFLADRAEIATSTD